jgi:hypothetical protein
MEFVYKKMELFQWLASPQDKTLFGVAGTQFLGYFRNNVFCKSKRYDR